MISVVIRCKNEVESLAKLVSFYENQSYKEYELIVVDNDSADNTESFCKEKNLKIVKINAKDFSHARSCNLGLKNANYDLVYFTNAHSFPIHENILQKISDVMDSDLKVAGLFGRCYVYQDSGKVNFIEKVYGGLDELYWSKNYKVVKVEVVKITC